MRKFAKLDERTRECIGDGCSELRMGVFVEFISPKLIDENNYKPRTVAFECQLKSLGYVLNAVFRFNDRR